jgi:hypothetical protein
MKSPVHDTASELQRRLSGTGTGIHNNINNKHAMAEPLNQEPRPRTKAPELICIHPYRYIQYMHTYIHPFPSFWRTLPIAPPPVYTCQVYTRICMLYPIPPTHCTPQCTTLSFPLPYPSDPRRPASAPILRYPPLSPPPQSITSTSSSSPPTKEAPRPRYKPAQPNPSYPQPRRACGADHPRQGRQGKASTSQDNATCWRVTRSAPSKPEPKHIDAYPLHPGSSFCHTCIRDTT